VAADADAAAADVLGLGEGSTGCLFVVGVGRVVGAVDPDL
jgi:hypothetical protein